MVANAASWPRSDLARAPYARPERGYLRILPNALARPTPVLLVAGIAFAWTRFPRLRDNDRHFYIAMRALLDGDRAKAQSELEACIACSVGGEYPRRLAEAALRSPALKP